MAAVTLPTTAIEVNLSSVPGTDQIAVIDRSPIMIAATALVHDMSVVTRNRADPLPTEAHVIDPWETVGH